MATSTAVQRSQGWYDRGINARAGVSITECYANVFFCGACWAGVTNSVCWCRTWVIWVLSRKAEYDESPRWPSWTYKASMSRIGLRLCQTEGDMRRKETVCKQRRNGPLRSKSRGTKYVVRGISSCVCVCHANPHQWHRPPPHGHPPPINVVLWGGGGAEEKICCYSQHKRQGFNRIVSLTYVFWNTKWKWAITHGIPWLTGHGSWPLWPSWPSLISCENANPWVGPWGPAKAQHRMATKLA